MGWITRLLLLPLLASSVALVHAQTYPVKPLRIVVGFTASGPSDTVARIVAQQFTKMGFEIVGNSPEQYAVFLREENVKWSKVIKDLGLRAE